MYESFFGLTCEPFSVAADPRFIYKSPKHRQARAHLMYGLKRGAGFILLTGEIGAGKTTVCRQFLQDLPGSADVAFVVNPRLDARALLLRVCEDLRITVPHGTIDLIDTIHGHLLLAHAAGRRTLIVVDEAQALSFDVMEQLRLLTNLDSSGSKLQVFLIGQPELRTMLRHPTLEPLAQRVVSRFHLGALAEPETSLYIAHRLRVAGLEGPVPFDESAVEAIHRLCGGVPRRINVLCDQALFAAQSAATRTIDAQMIEHVASEVFDAGPDPEPSAVVPDPDLEQVDSSVHSPPLYKAPPPDLQPHSMMKASTPPPRMRWSFLAGVVGGIVLVCAVVAGVLIGSGYVKVVSSSAAATPFARILPPAPEAASAAMAAANSAPSPASTAATMTTTPATATQDAVPAPAKTVTSAGAALLASAAEFDSALDNAATEDNTLWRELAQLWNVTLPAGQPCLAVQKQGLRCYFGGGGLSTIRQLDRPGIVKLHRADGHVVYAVLTGLTDSTAAMRIGTAQKTIPLTALAGRWRGDFATLWRPPAGYRNGDASANGVGFADTVGQKFAALNGGDTTSGDTEQLSAQVSVFQIAHGLEPDGRPGPLTLMQLNRASGVAEPKLRAEP